MKLEPKPLGLLEVLAGIDLTPSQRKVERPTRGVDDHADTPNYAFFRNFNTSRLSSP